MLHATRLSRRRSLCAAIVLSLTAATPASASRWDLPPPDLSGRAVLLGGSSAMAQVLVAQRTVSEEAAAEALKAPVPAIAAPAVHADTAPADAAPGAGPNVFGTITLAIGQTPMDGRWRQANAGRPARALGRWTAAFENADREAQLRAVNAWVNERIAPVADGPAGAGADRWQSAAESLGRGRGDCEDYALAKMQLLAALGFDRDDLYLVLVRDLPRQADHAVLLVRLGNRFVMLDNLRGEPVDADRVHEYRPVMSFSSAGRWIHGVAAEPRSAPPVQIAAVALATAGP